METRFPELFIFCSNQNWGGGWSPGPLCGDPSPRPPSGIILVAFICLYWGLSPLSALPLRGPRPPSLLAYSSPVVEHDFQSGAQFASPPRTPVWCLWFLRLSRVFWLSPRRFLQTEKAETWVILSVVCPFLTFPNSLKTLFLSFLSSPSPASMAFVLSQPLFCDFSKVLRGSSNGLEVQLI